MNLLAAGWEKLPDWTPLSAALVVAGFLVLMLLIRGRRAIRGAVVSAGGGLAALGLVNLTGLLTGVMLPFNVFSTLVCLLLGVPGVVSLLFLQLFW